MKFQLKNGTWIALLLTIGVIAFFSGKLLYYKDGYRDGVIFADSSSYKRGKVDGYREGYEYCDSITEDIDSLRSTEMFNLNIILEELADPFKYIKVSGTVDIRDNTGRDSKYVKGRIVNTSSFARYNDLEVKAIFKDKREGIIREFSIALPDVLYPRKSMNFEINEGVPELTASVELVLTKAQGVD